MWADLLPVVSAAYLHGRKDGSVIGEKKNSSNREKSVKNKKKLDR